MIVLAVAGAGALGSPCRYLLEAAISRRTGHGFPWGTTVVNLLGAFTTFSTFAVETTRLEPRARALYVTMSVVGGVGLAATGLALASL